ncbi:hypothetical protein ACI8AC_06695 [Geodermatophilus sp. SYSU D00758]
MATEIAGMSKESLARAIGLTGAAFGAVSVVAPRAVARAYGVPVSSAGLQLQRLFGSRGLAVAALTLTADTEREIDRGLAVVAGMNAVDVLTALGAAKGAGSATTLRAVLSSLLYGGAALAVRSMRVPVHRRGLLRRRS